MLEEVDSQQDGEETEVDFTEDMGVGLWRQNRIMTQVVNDMKGTVVLRLWMGLWARVNRLDKLIVTSFVFNRGNLWLRHVAVQMSNTPTEMQIR